DAQAGSLCARRQFWRRTTLQPPDGARSLEAESVRAKPVDVTTDLGHQRRRLITPASGTDASPREVLTLVKRTCAAVSLERGRRPCCERLTTIREGWLTSVQCVNDE